MLRIAVGAVLVLAVVVAAGDAADKAEKAQKQKKTQMVKGTVKSIDIKTGVLVVNQKLKSETVERQLDIKDTTEFEVTIDGEKMEATGKDGMALLKEGAQVTVKCDKDVNVLKVTAKIKK